MALLLTLIPVVYVPAFITGLFLFAQPSKWKQFLPVYLFCIFIFAYCTTPNYVNDLTRYTMQMESFSQMSLGEVFQNEVDSLFITNTFFWLAGKMGLYHLIPGISTSLVYGVAAHISCHYANKYGYSKYLPMAFIIQFGMLPFFSIVCNIRNVAAFAIGVYGAYYEYEKGKRNIWALILYIAPIFIHKTGLLILFIRLVIPVFKRWKYLSFLFIIALPVGIEYAYNHVYWFNFGGVIGRYLTRLVLSAHNYLLGESDYAAAVRASIGSSIIRLTVFAFLILIVWLIIRDSRNNSESSFMTFALLLCAFSFACNVFDTPAYWRFAVAAVCACGPILLRFASGNILSRRDTQLVTLLLLAIAGARFALSCYTFYTRVDLNAFFPATLTTNIYTVTWELLKGLFAL